MKRWGRKKSVLEIKNGDNEAEILYFYSQATHITPPKGITIRKGGNFKERLRYLIRRIKIVKV